MKRTIQMAYGIALCVAIFHLIASTAMAAMIDVDFRDPHYFGGNGNQSFSNTEIIPEVVLSISAFYRNGEASLWWDDVDGYGVQSEIKGLRYDFEKDEIQGREYLQISFSEKVFLFEVHITDLFHENGYREKGLYSLDNGATWNLFQAESGQIPGASNGETDVYIEALTDSIIFRTPRFRAFRNHDFSIAGLSIEPADTVPTPIPPAILLLGGGLSGLGLYRRYHRRSAMI